MRDIVFIDFDKTLVKKDTLIPLVFFIARFRKKMVNFFAFLLCFIIFKMKFISNKQLKVIFLKYFFDGLPPDALKKIFHEFENGFIKENLNKDIYFKFNDHLKGGYDIIIVSSNFTLMLENLETIKGARIIATETDYEDEGRRYTIKGDVCAGKEKINRIAVAFGSNIFEEASFYGDKNDEIVLKAFKKSFKV